jgi:diguanylate cyclase (GGDEF)-like protein
MVLMTRTDASTSKEGGMRDTAPGGLMRVVRALAPVPWAIIVVGGILVIALPGGSATSAARNAVSLTIALFFGVLLVRLLLTARTERRRARWAQLTLAGAFVLWAGGSVLISDNQAYGSVPFPAPGEVFNVASYLLLATFLLIDVRRRRPSLADFLDAAVVWGATITVTSLVLVTPVARNFDHSGLALLVAVLFPLINLVLAAVVVGQVLLRERPRSVRTWMLVAGFLMLAVGDSSFLAGLSTSDAYGTNIGISAVWGVGFAFLGEAASRTQLAESSARPVRAKPVVLVAAAALGVVVLATSPEDFAGWLVRGSAILTLLATGWRLTLALREARGAAEAMALSLTDELTGLPNRRSAAQEVDHAIQHRGPVSVLLLDVDSFKDINDSLGHAVGDDVLIALADRICEVVGTESSVARLGGDEFAIVVPSEDELALFEVAQEIRAALRRPLRVEGIDLSLDASVGIAMREDSDSSAIEMLRRADVAMYEAKQSRAGVLLFDRAQDGMSHLRLLRGEALRSAIAKGELIAWYQPQIDARTRQVVAMEALVRWWHPTEGLLPPIAFLPDARRAGLMPALTETLMRQVVADARRWMDQGFTFRVAMNWAPPELVSGQLLPELFSVLDDAGLPPDSLLVEVTEDSFLADPERARMVLHELRAHGVQVAIDDYGTGFSSLAYLRDLPVQELKMDRSFIAPVVEDERSRMIVQTTSQMARALGLRFVAEGVEDAVSMAALVPLGVDVLQGYHIARPMPADAVLPWVRHWDEIQLSSRLR